MKWRDRTQIYRERKRSKSFKYKVDLTKRRVTLLTLLLTVFVDINCRLNVRFMDDSVKAFSCETELASVIASCDER